MSHATPPGPSVPNRVRRDGLAGSLAAQVVFLGESRILKDLKEEPARNVAFVDGNYKHSARGVLQNQMRARLPLFPITLPPQEPQQIFGSRHQTPEVRWEFTNR